MSTVAVTAEIDAPVGVVFGVITDIEKLPETNPQITEIEFLSEQRSGQGTRFIETRSMDGRTFSSELELTECVDNSQARFVTDAGGTVWDTMFTFEETAGGGTRLEIKLDARPHRLLSKLMNPFVMGKVRSGMEEHIGSLKEYCESLESPS